jgi:hypothetical protein|tara:strand:+ start:1982 stop:2191 length:210 start_codon:yes stop_codon:yes gene_type:complete
MKKYVLIIKYESNTGEVEFIEESIVDDELIPEGSILVDKCISQFYNEDISRYNELIKISKDSGYIIGDA